MRVKLLTAWLFLTCFSLISGQTGQQLNQTDSNGRKQGRWIKEYPNGNIMYDGFFVDDKPSGEFKRYYEDNNLKSILIFSKDGNEAAATLYYSNGFVASRGKYNNQHKEGKWQFFSSTNQDVLISEEHYTADRKNGPSVKYYPDKTIAEVVNYVNDTRHGDWIKYYPDGTLSLKTRYVNGKLDGPFEAFYENSKPELTGQYKNDIREGQWIIYKNDGSVRFKTFYTLGMPDNREMDIYETNYLDSLEKNIQKIPDPEKTGEIW